MTENSINDPGLIDEVLPDVPVGDLPEPGDFSLLQPGSYVFRLPDTELILEAYEPFQTDVGQRVKFNFGRNREKGINAAFKVPALANKTAETRIDNRERRIGDATVSDLALLLQALGFKGVLNTNQAYVEAIAGFGGEEFLGEWEWRTTCNPKNDTYDAEGNKRVGKKGCGQAYAINAFQYKRGPKAGTKVFAIPYRTDSGDGKTQYAERFTCATEGCGAYLRAFGSFRSFKPVE